MDIKKTYLIVYNVLLLLGWLAIFVRTFSVILDTELNGKNNWHQFFLNVYLKVEIFLKLSQTAAVLEIFHCLVKIVPSSPTLTGFQVFSRLFILWFVTDLIPLTQEAPGVILYLVCWTVTEIIRYSYYALNIIGRAPYILTWCRYTFFFVLYPVGVLGELITIYSALGVVWETRMLSIALPNVINFSFSYYVFLLFVMFCYIPIFPKLYCHMVAQRRKFIGSKKEKAH